MPQSVIHLIAGARPNFMKIAPLLAELRRHAWCKPVFVHTGQHYDATLSDHILRDLGVGEPDFNLEIGSGSHAEQTAGVMVAYEKLCLENRPDWVVVVGDVNSTLAATLTAKKLDIPVAHLEAGLRSGDRTMPEELNRLATDALADLLWTPSPDADENLRREGIPEERIVRVGNIMIDSFEMVRAEIEAVETAMITGGSDDAYSVVTLHRPANVDAIETLRPVVRALKAMSERLPVVFPVHPRTRASLERHGLLGELENYNIRMLEPLTYVDFMALVLHARLIVTDSGGIQEETTYLGIPCLTLRPNTERPITITNGTNKLVTAENLAAELDLVLDASRPVASPPELWDGKTAGRVAESLHTATGNPSAA